MMSIEFFGKEQNWDSEQTTYYFKVDGDKYSAIDNNGAIAVISEDEEMNLTKINSGQVFDLVIQHCHLHISD